MGTNNIKVTTDLLINLEKKIENLNPWQARCYFHSRNDTFRNLIKGRQIGADYYFALEALISACYTGEDQIFIDETFFNNNHQEIVSNAYMYTLLHLGLADKKEEATISKKIRLDNGAVIYFPNHRWELTGMAGNVYCSEWCFSENPIKTLKIARALSLHNRYKETYYTSICEGKESLLINFSDRLDRIEHSKRVRFLPPEVGNMTNWDVISRLRNEMGESAFRRSILCDLSSF